MSRQLKHLSTTQQLILTTIARFSRENGYPPVMREIGEAIGISRQGVHHQLRKLRDAGLVQWDAESQRTLRLAEGVE